MKLKFWIANRVVILSIVCLFLIGTARATNFTVNSTLDGSDAAPGDGVCATTIGNCTLRAAIQETNALAGYDFIGFAIPGAGVKTFHPASEYPIISDSVIIDGGTQGVSDTPLIEIDGTNAGLGRNGFNITMADGDIRKLAINRFRGAGINLLFGGAGGTVIESCFIGTDPTGTVALGNQTGIIINTANNKIGPYPDQGNLISGNNADGIIIINAAATGNKILDNYIGTDVTGTIALGNGGNGITVDTSNNIIGGAYSDQGNIISGNGGDGIYVSGTVSAADGNEIIGNYIGTSANGTGDLGNGGDGIELFESSNNRIGGFFVLERNIIAFNGENGVKINQNNLAVSTSVGNSIRGNSIFSNDSLGIDLFPAGVSVNDVGDNDEGPNNLLNFPVLTDASNAGSATNITGSLNSKPGIPYNIDFYSSASCDSSGNGEGETYIGSKAVTTGAGGNAAFTFSPAVQVAAGRFITATTTRNAAPLNTSEFSQCVAVASNQGNLSFSSAAYTANESAGTKTITVARTGGTIGQITVDYATQNGTATAGQDYTATSGTLTFLNGETVKTFDVPINNDTLDETNETVNLTLNNPTFGVLLTPNATAVLTINDNDNPPTVSITDVSLEEGNEGTTNYTFTVNLSAPSSFDISVDYATANGSATAGIDYAARSGTLVFSAAAAETSKTITVPVNGDLVVELNETFFVNLSNPVNAAFGDNQGRGTIVDDDNPGKFSFSFAPYSGVENTQVVVTVSRSNGDAGTVSVDYTTSGGTASPGADYTPVAGTLFFGDGELTKTFAVTLLDDASPEPTENFNVVLSNPIGGAILGTPSSASINILDNDTGTLLNIAGEILKANGTPLTGATVNLTGAQNATITTNNLGRFAFPNLAPNGNYTVTPAALGFTFNPLNRQYTNLSADVINANFTATAAPTRQLRIVGGNATPTQNVTATVELVAQGDENSVGFSLNFNQNVLMNPQVILNPAASTATLVVNNLQVGAGKLGIILALPAGQAFTVGTKSLVTVTFNTTATNLYSSPVTFGNAPVVSQIANSNASSLSVNYLDGAVTFAQGYEADVVDRPMGTNNGTITVSDFTQVGRFAAGLDTDYQLNEFQRADCAPRESLGDGFVTVTDYTQAGRYAAGLDPATPTGGQYSARFFESDTKGNLLSDEFEILGDNRPSAPTVVRVVNATASSGGQVTISIETVAQGTENGFGFTLNYDQNKLSNPIVELGSGVPANSTLFPNTNTTGRVGVILGLPFNVGLTAGTKQLVTIRFNVANNATGGQTALTFADAPVVSEVSDVTAHRMQSTFQNGAVNILGPTAASVAISGRVTGENHRGVSGARVTMTDASGARREARTNSFGYYNFTDVPAGATYIFAVTHKRFEFAAQVVFISEDLADFNFVATPKAPLVTAGF